MSLLISIIGDMLGIIKFVMNMDEIDLSEEFYNIGLSAHDAFWNSLMGSGELNEGQESLALVAMDEGAGYLEEALTDFDPSDYRDAIESSADGMSEALSQSIHEASLTISHNLTSASTGVAKFAGGFE